MFRNENFLLREVAGSQVLVPVGTAVGEFAGIVTLNDAGAHLWNALEEEQTVETLASVLIGRYDVSLEQTTADAKKFIEKLQGVGAVD
ncbi:MAG: PqqD family protein [Ruminococcaceae bacterium]|nr:PqqD family protein [Oscillospiraceae bacterium]